MKILHIATNDPAGAAIALVKATNRATEHRARLIVRETKFSCDFDRDLCLADLGGDYGEVEALLAKADVLHFHNQFHDGMVLGPVRVADYTRGKLLVHHEHGHYDFRFGDAGLWRRVYLRPGRRVLVSTPDLLRLLPEASWVPNPVPIHEPLYLPRPDAHAPGRKVRVVQAPTQRWLKDTETFLAAGRAISARHPEAEFALLEGLTHREVLRRKRSAQVVFDHLQGYYGMSSLESLSQGVPVVAGLAEDVRAAMEAFAGTSDLPWVLAKDAASLEKRLEELVQDPALRAELGRRSRAFMEERWNEERVVERLVKAYTA